MSQLSQLLRTLPEHGAVRESLARLLVPAQAGPAAVEEPAQESTQPVA